MQLGCLSILRKNWIKLESKNECDHMVGTLVINLKNNFLLIKFRQVWLKLEVSITKITPVKPNRLNFTEVVMRIYASSRILY